MNEWMDAFRMAIFAYCGKYHIGKICVKPSFIMDMQLHGGARGLVWD